MSNIIIFADNTANDLEFWPNHQGKRLATKIAGPHRVATEVRKAGFTCQVIQMFTTFTAEELTQVCNKFINSDTITISFSTVFWGNNNIIIETLIAKIVDHAKMVNKDIKVALGGPNGLSLLPRVNNIDAVFLGYSEKQFTDYNISLRDKTSIPEYTRKEDNAVIYDVTASDQTFDFCRSQIIYQREDCIDYGEPMVIEVGRGCIFKCKFCAYPMNGKKKLDFIKDYTVLTEELIYNYENFGIYKYIISDDTFNDSTTKIKELHKVFTSLPFKIYFVCYLRLDLLYAHREQINLLKEMGMRSCNFGIESFHDRAASTIGKGLGGDKSKKFLKELKTELWGDQVKIQIGLITGLPHETYESYEETKQWILDPENLIDNVVSTALAIRNPIYDSYPYKSEFQLSAAKYGYYWPDPKSISNWKNLSSPVKTSHDAKILEQEYAECASSVSRHRFGGFTLFMLDRFVKYYQEPYSFEEQLKMNRFEYTTWIIRNNKNAVDRYIQNYIDSLLNL